MPIGCNFYLKKKVLILQLNFIQGSSTKERQLVACSLVIVHHITGLRFSYLDRAIKGRENSNLFFQEAEDIEGIGIDFMDKRFTSQIILQILQK